MSSCSTSSSGSKGARGQARRRGRALTKRLSESALEGEITDHLGYERHDADGDNSGNSRNGRRAKAVLTDIGSVEIEVPRDRDGTFEPQIVKKRQRRLSGVDEISHVAAGQVGRFDRGDGSPEAAPSCHDVQGGR